MRGGFKHQIFEGSTVNVLIYLIYEYVIAEADTHYSLCAIVDIIQLIGPCKGGGSRDSGFKFQTDQGFWIQILKRARFRIQISKRARFRIHISISKQFFGIHISKWLGFRIQISNRWDSGFRFGLTGPYMYLSHSKHLIFHTVQGASNKNQSSFFVKITKLQIVLNWRF